MHSQILALMMLLQGPFGPAPAPAPAPAAKLVITGPVAAAPYTMVRLAVNADPAAAVVWDITPEDMVDIEESASGRIMFTGPPGTYRVKARQISLANGQTSVLTARSTVVIGIPDPPPAPTPGPAPAPGPTPASAFGRWAVVVVDDQAPSAAVSQIVNGPALTALKSAGKCRIYGLSVDRDVLAQKNYTAAIGKVPSPVLLILSKDGKQTKAMPLPLDEATLTATLKELMLP